MSGGRWTFFEKLWERFRFPFGVSHPNKYQTSQYRVDAGAPKLVFFLGRITSRGWRFSVVSRHPRKRYNREISDGVQSSLTIVNFFDDRSRIGSLFNDVPHSPVLCRLVEGSLFPFTFSWTGDSCLSKPHKKMYSFIYTVTEVQVLALPFFQFIGSL